MIYHTNHPLSPSYIFPYSKIKLSCNTEADFWKVISVVFIGHTKPSMPPLLPLSSWTGGQ